MSTDLSGATEPGDRAAYASNPGEFAARWNARSEDERSAWLSAINEAFQRWAGSQHERPTVTTEQVEAAVRTGWPSLFENRFAVDAQDDTRRKVRDILAALGIEVRDV
jgi:hypothetical protein